MNSKIQYVDISTIKPNKNNPRTITEEKLEDLKESLRKYPRLLELRPLVVDDKGFVLGGNMRLRAINELGIEKVPVLKVSNLTSKKRRRFILLDNVTYGEWDFDILGKNFAPAELEELGIDLPDILAVDYRALQNENGDAEIADMARNTKKAIMIEFSQEDYDEAYELVSSVRKSGKDVGKLVLKLLKKDLAEK